MQVITFATFADRGWKACSRVVLDSFFRTDSTLTHMAIQVTQLRLNSNPKFANLTQLRLNSKPKFTNLTHDSSHFTYFGGCGREGGGVTGGGGWSNVAVGWFFLCKVTDNCKIVTFSLRKISD